MREEAVQFGADGSLVGVVTEPATAARGRAPPAFVFLNAGVTHRVGPNRMYVRLARALAEEGFAALRFDFSGLGDSAPRDDDLPVTRSVVVETREAMDHLAKTRGTGRFVLIGICSGATVSHMVAQVDRRVIGAVLINAQGHLHGDDAEVGARLRERTVARHAWRIALRSSFRAKNWRKALGGKLEPLRILRMMLGTPFRLLFRRRSGSASGSASDSASGAAASLTALSARGVRVYHLYCEGDEGLDYFHAALGKAVGEVTSDGLSRYEVVRGANHLFTLLWSQEDLVQRVCAWARELPGTGNTSMEATR